MIKCYTNLRLLYFTIHVTNASVREIANNSPVSSIIKTWQLCFFGYVAHSDSKQNHHRTISASLRPQEIGGDLEGACVPPGWGELMLMYSWLTLVFTQSGGRSTIVFQLGARHEDDLPDTVSTPAGQCQHQPTAKHRQLKLPQISAGTNASQLLLNWLILPVFHGMVKFSIGWSGFPQEDW